jgi:hypothetical protein
VEKELIERAPFSDITVERLAVNREQIEKWNLHTRPTKTTDTRESKFRSIYGTDSVELDAIPPDELRRLVKSAIEGHMNPRSLERLRLAKQSERETLRNISRGREENNDLEES